MIRDRLLGLLWPESDEDTARHLLSDSIYFLGRAVGSSALLAAVDEDQVGDVDNQYPVVRPKAADTGLAFTGLTVRNRSTCARVGARSAPGQPKGPDSSATALAAGGTPDPGVSGLQPLRARWRRRGMLELGRLGDAQS